MHGAHAPSLRVARACPAQSHRVNAVLARGKSDRRLLAMENDARLLAILERPAPERDKLGTDSEQEAPSNRKRIT
eukprot:3432474-Pyramimonas_sp.AAC.1